MLEEYAFYILAAGAGLGLIGYLWLMVRAFRQSILWGVGLFVPPLALVFITRHFAKARGPVLVLVLAGLLVGAPYAASYYERNFIPPKPYEQMVGGELRITLTGLKDFDYAALARRGDVVVLQMANDDVDDRTLEHLKGLSKLRTLDLSNSRITDAGLATAAALPALRDLYLARTAITDEGFQTHLGSLATLRRVDLTGTAVKGKTKRQWKQSQPERDYVD